MSVPSESGNVVFSQAPDTPPAEDAEGLLGEAGGGSARPLVVKPPLYSATRRWPSRIG